MAPEAGVSADEAVTILRAAERAHPVFVAQGWTWHQKGVPTVEQIAETLTGMLARARAENVGWTSTGRLQVEQNTLCGWRLSLEIGQVPDCAITNDCGDPDHQHYLDYLNSLDAPSAGTEPLARPTNEPEEV